MIKTNHLDSIKIITKTIIEDLGNFLSKVEFNNSKIFLIGLFSLLYLPHCFILNNGIGMALAYETDAGTIMEAAIGLLDNYNFLDHTHSRSYGWTYFAIQYVFLKPIKIFLDIFAFSNNAEILIFSARLLFFLIGLISLILFHEVLLKIFKQNNFYALLGSIFYAIKNLGLAFIYVRVESTGIAFMLAGVLALLNFLESNNNKKLYYYGLTFLVLSSLTKQIFFFTSLPILGIFVYKIIEKDGFDFKKLLILIGNSISIAFLILLIINPFLIFDFQKFFGYQISLMNHHNKDGFNLNLLSDKERLNIWMMVLSSLPIVTFYYASTIITYFLAIAKCKKNTGYGIFLVMISSIYIIFLLIFFNNRLYISDHFLAPIFPFCIINILIIIRYFSKNILSFLLLVFYIINMIQSFYYTVNYGSNRLFRHQESAAYKSYEYILNNLNREDKVIHDMFVAMPDNMRENSCNYNYFFEDKCLNRIQNPDYIIIFKEYALNGQRSKKLQEIIDYIEKNNMILIEEINDFRNNELKISVYKK